MNHELPTPVGKISNQWLLNEKTVRNYCPKYLILDVQRCPWSDCFRELLLFCSLCMSRYKRQGNDPIFSLLGCTHKEAFHHVCNRFWTRKLCRCVSYLNWAPLWKGGLSETKQIMLPFHSTYLPQGHFGLMSHIVSLNFFIFLRMPSLHK